MMKGGNGGINTKNGESESYIMITTHMLARARMTSCMTGRHMVHGYMHPYNIKAQLVTDSALLLSTE